MSRQIALLAGLFLLWSMPCESIAAQGDALDAHLAAGQYTLALKVARDRSTPELHDTALARVAMAQASAGSRSASLRTAGEIYDDRQRYRLLKQIGSQRSGARGGGVEPDFDALIELITATIAPNSWDEVGGPGAISEFAGGVYVDAQGVLRKTVRKPSTELTIFRTGNRPKAPQTGVQPSQVRHSSPLRKVSLTRLEKHLQLRQAAGRGPTEAMRLLAGLQRIQYILVYPESGDLVIAGPAGDWQPDTQGRMVSVEGGRPVLHLDDLVVILRHLNGSADARFGCSITPVQQALARTQAFLTESSKTSLRPSRREHWLEQLRSRLGQQEIDVRGIDPRTRVARVLVEADYHMKLIGMGLEPGVLGVTSYLDSIQVPKGQAPPPMDVLRWWFTLGYQAVMTGEDRNAYELRGQGVKLLSENELLTAQGKRVHTGRSDVLNQQFAQSFTTHFAALCTKYPIYADLQNMFDLAMVAALIRSEGLAEKVGWHMTCLGDPDEYSVSLGDAPQRVETVINHRVINKKHILAGVSGGVTVAPGPLVTRDAIEVDRQGRLKTVRYTAQEKPTLSDPWWWD